jgi:hypothetical protein
MQSVDVRVYSMNSVDVGYADKCVVLVLLEYDHQWEIALRV